MKFLIFSLGSDKVGFAWQCCALLIFQSGVMSQAIDSAPLALGWCIPILPWALPKANDFAPLVLVIQ